VAVPSGVSKFIHSNPGYIAGEARVLWVPEYPWCRPRVTQSTLKYPGYHPLVPLSTPGSMSPVEIHQLELQLLATVCAVLEGWKYGVMPQRTIPT
jgi:hypothetical protein